MVTTRSRAKQEPSGTAAANSSNTSTNTLNAPPKRAKKAPAAAAAPTTKKPASKVTKVSRVTKKASPKKPAAITEAPLKRAPRKTAVPAKAAPAQATQVKATQAKAAPAKATRAKATQAKATQAKASQAKASQAEASQAEAKEVLATPVKPASPVQEEDPLAEFPQYPSTPDVYPLAEFPQYPTTPDVNPLAQFPQYPSTPNVNPLGEFPQYPTTPDVNPMAEHPQYPTTPNVNPLAEFPQYPTTPNVNPLAEFPQYPTTPNVNPLAEFPQYPTTPAVNTMAQVQSQPSTPEQRPASTQRTAFQSDPTTPEQNVSPGKPEVSFALNVEVPNLPSMGLQNPTLNPPSLHASNWQTPALQVPSLRAPSPQPIAKSFPNASPYKSAMRSPQKPEVESPKKSVSFQSYLYTSTESMFFNPDGLLAGSVFFCDVQHKGRDQAHLYATLLEELGALVADKWDKHTRGITHVLFKDGDDETLEKVAATHGEVKCVDLGFILDCEKFNKRMDESDYAVDLNPNNHSKPEPKRQAYTPARTPSKFFMGLETSSLPSTPPTPTSSEFDRSFVEEEKENTKPSPLYKLNPNASRNIMRTCPTKLSVPESTRKLYAQTPTRNARPSTFKYTGPVNNKYLAQSPGRSLLFQPRTAQPTRKRMLEDLEDDESFGMPKKLRFS